MFGRGGRQRCVGDDASLLIVLGRPLAGLKLECLSTISAMVDEIIAVKAMVFHDARRLGANAGRPRVCTGASFNIISLIAAELTLERS